MGVRPKADSVLIQKQPTRARTSKGLFWMSPPSMLQLSYIHGLDSTRCCRTLKASPYQALNSGYGNHRTGAGKGWTQAVLLGSEAILQGNNTMLSLHLRVIPCLCAILLRPYP